MSDRRSEERCPACGGGLIAGEVGVPLLGSPRFSYRVGTGSIDAEVEAQMCERCGALLFRVRDPSRIRAAHRALRRARGQ